MPAPKPEVLEFLLSRRSRPARTLTLPVPTREDLRPILTAALRTPDHGKLEPWRLVVVERPAMSRLAALAEARADALGLDEDARFKGRSQFEASHLAVVVVASPKASGKVPEVEQILSAGAVCLSLLNAAEAAGWGANWLTGWPAHDRPFAAEAFGLREGEFVAGILHIGSETVLPPERPRPDVAALTTWIAE